MEEFLVDFLAFGLGEFVGVLFDEAESYSTKSCFDGVFGICEGSVEMGGPFRIHETVDHRKSGVWSSLVDGEMGGFFGDFLDYLDATCTGADHSDAFVLDVDGRLGPNCCMVEYAFEGVDARDVGDVAFRGESGGEVDELRGADFGGIVDSELPVRVRGVPFERCDSRVIADVFAEVPDFVDMFEVID